MLPKNQMVASYGNIMEDKASSSLDEDIFQRSKQLERARRDLQRIQESVTYRLGQHITDAVRSKWKIPFLPISFPIAIFLLGLEKIGLRPHPKTERDYGEYVPENVVLLFPTNGVGFGHFTRMYGLARKIKKQDPEAEVIFFTPMPTLHIPYLDNFPTYHVAGKYKFQEMSSTVWNGIIEEQLLMIIELHKPKAFVFDGAFPYRGMLNAISGYPKLRKYWMKRGMIKKGSNIPIDSIEFFDCILHPGDAVQPSLDAEYNSMQIPPITLIEEEEMLSKEAARNRLSLPQDSVVWYLQLGAGQINDIDSEIRMTVDSILENDVQNFIVLGESMLGERISISDPRVKILRDYPNGIYFKAFDYSVQAGGYNSFHEMRRASIPTVFYPNMNTGMDDQLSRCKLGEREGWGIVVEKRTKKAIVHAVRDAIELVPKPVNDDQSNSESDWVASILGNF